MTELELLKLKAGICDMLLNEKCEWDGGFETVQYLAQSGYTKEDMLALEFDEKTIDEALESLQEDTEQTKETELPTEDEINNPNLDNEEDIREYVSDYLEQTYKCWACWFEVEFDTRKIYISKIDWDIR